MQACFLKYSAKLVFSPLGEQIEGHMHRLSTNLLHVPQPEVVERWYVWLLLCAASVHSCRPALATEFGTVPPGALFGGRNYHCM